MSCEQNNYEEGGDDRKCVVVSDCWLFMKEKAWQNVENILKEVRTKGNDGRWQEKEQQDVAKPRTAMGVWKGGRGYKFEGGTW